MSTMLRFAHAVYNKNKHYKWQLKSGLTMKLFNSEMVFGLEWEETAFYGQKRFWEINNCLCQVSTA